VAVIILHGSWARGEYGGVLELVLFMDDGRTGSETRWLAGTELVARHHPLCWLEGDSILQPSHRGGALLKDRGERGLAYLLRLLRERSGEQIGEHISA
jgi:hypothetical protein